MLDIIIKDMTNAMKEKDKFSLSVLRMLKSTLQMEKINKKHDLSDEEIVSVIKKQVKTRKDSIVEYEKYGKDDTILELKNEIEILSKYLPEELSFDDIKKNVDQVFDELKPESMKDMGRIMKELTDRIGSKADMSQVSSIVKNRLQ